MSGSGLTVVVIGYDNADDALTDYEDLVRVIGGRDLPHFEAAVLGRDGSTYEILESTVAAREPGTRLGACLGVVVGIAASPVIAAAIVGGGLGLLIGNVIDKFDAFKHTSEMTAAKRLMDDSASNLIAIADESTNTEIVAAALRRSRRVVAEITMADTETLEKDLQREGLRWRY